MIRCFLESISIITKVWHSRDNTHRYVKRNAERRARARTNSRHSKKWPRKRKLARVVYELPYLLLPLRYYNATYNKTYTINSIQKSKSFRWQFWFQLYHILRSWWKVKFEFRTLLSYVEDPRFYHTSDFKRDFQSNSRETIPNITCIFTSK